MPYEITSFKKYLDKFDIFLDTAANKSINNLKLRIHPLNKDSEKHKKFVTEIKKKITEHKQKFEIPFLA